MTCCIIHHYKAKQGSLALKATLISLRWKIIVSVRKLLFLHGGGKIGSSFYNIISDVVLWSSAAQAGEKIETGTELWQIRIEFAASQFVDVPTSFMSFVELELELELIQTHMTQKPMLRDEVAARYTAQPLKSLPSSTYNSLQSSN